MSADQEISQASPPRYLRDCLESMFFFKLSSEGKVTAVVFKIFSYLSTRPALMSSEDAVRVELSLKVAESLVRSHVFAAREVSKTAGAMQKGQGFTHYSSRSNLSLLFHFQISVQLTKVLLHMEDKYSINGFLCFRQATMVALAVTDTIPVRPPTLVSAAFSFPYYF